jgi:hypothetical protein
MSRKPWLVQPQRLGQREGQDAVVAVAGEDVLEHAPAAHRLARDADRLARGAPDHVVGVRAQRVEVDEREGRVEVGGRVPQPGEVVHRSEPYAVNAGPGGRDHVRVFAPGGETRR